ncbi:uncharacterized protein LOC126417124 [Schistocerca serialis cubense]|uniref:uncharacterized protein LOC126417124 n=1 Tax=Schistocerca serialis cubense TaxID=2023355 RepID=UPI00214F57EB|nr:uncharacterized protein LOC126417124 [Schistocerca serialis cubense]
MAFEENTNKIYSGSDEPVQCINIKTGVIEATVPQAAELAPAAHGSLLDPAWLLLGFPLLGSAWHTACFLCLTFACYLTVFRLVRWNRSTRHRLEDNLDRLVTMKQFSELTDQHHRVRTQMNHQVHMYGLLDEEVDRLRDDAKTLLKTVASAERALLPACGVGRSG